MLIKCDALRIESFSSVGRTKPLIIDCEYSKENTPVRKNFLVKAIGLPEIILSDLYCELLGNLIAREFGIETPEPAVVNLSEEFIQANNKAFWERNLKIKSGFGVGCEYFSQGFTAVTSNMFLTKELFEQAVLIYGFDLLSQNPDRPENNPNCAVKGDKIIAFDFEKSLGFAVYPIIGGTGNSWEVSKLKFERPHVFRSALKAKEREINWQPLVEKVKQINKAKIEEICSFVPSEFGNYTDKICEHFLSIAANSNQLEFELQRSLL
ncbi:MAG TPA: HipA family kinase [Pyrinomonadaceae bacterium]